MTTAIHRQRRGNVAGIARKALKASKVKAAKRANAVVYKSLSQITRRGQKARIDKTPATPLQTPWGLVVINATVDMFHGDKIAAKKWIKTRQGGLGGATPWAYATTEDGAREVLNLIGRIQHGVYT